jgi:hypothetical protein
VRVVGPGAGPWSIDITDQVIRVDSSAGDVQLTLPPLADYQGRGVLIFNIGPNSAIVNTTSPELFPDGTSQYTISAAGGTARITAGGVYST